MPCARCGTASTVFGTVFYVEKLLERYFAAMREVKALQQAEEAPNTTDTETAEQANQDSVQSDAPAVLQDVNLHNTNLLATAEQHAPLRDWFAAHQIEARFDYALADTSGFFDDAARMVGANYALYGELMDRVRYAYRKSHSWVNLELAQLAQKDAQAINALCRQLYSHTFFARYHYQKPEKIVRLTLQTAPAVRQFFDGGWLEWYAFMALIDHLQQRGQNFSCARGVKVVFPNEKTCTNWMCCACPQAKRRFVSNASRANFGVISTSICACASGWGWTRAASSCARPISPKNRLPGYRRCMT